MKQNRIILNFVIIFIIISFIISIFASSTTSFATSPSFVKKYKTITIGKNIQYQIKNLKKNYFVTYSVSNPSLASIHSKTGKLLTKKAGTLTIKATIYNKKHKKLYQIKDTITIIKKNKYLPNVSFQIKKSINPWNFTLTLSCNRILLKNEIKDSSLTMLPEKKISPKLRADFLELSADGKEVTYLFHTSSQKKLCPGDFSMDGKYIIQSSHYSKKLSITYQERLPNNTLAGFVLKQDGNPVKNAMLSLKTAHTTIQSNTDSHGYYQIKNAAKPLSLTVSKDGFQTVTLKNPLLSAKGVSCENITLRSKEDTNLSLEFFITDTEKHPIPDASITVALNDTEQSKNTSVSFDCLSQKDILFKKNTDSSGTLFLSNSDLSNYFPAPCSDFEIGQKTHLSYTSSYKPSSNQSTLLSNNELHVDEQYSIYISTPEHYSTSYYTQKISFSFASLSTNHARFYIQLSKCPNLSIQSLSLSCERDISSFSCDTVSLLLFHPEDKNPIYQYQIDYHSFQKKENEFFLSSLQLPVSLFDGKYYIQMQIFSKEKELLFETPISSVTIQNASLKTVKLTLKPLRFVRILVYANLENNTPEITSFQLYQKSDDFYFLIDTFSTDFFTSKDNTVFTAKLLLSRLIENETYLLVPVTDNIMAKEELIFTAKSENTFSTKKEAAYSLLPLAQIFCEQKDNISNSSKQTVIMDYSVFHDITPDFIRSSESYPNCILAFYRTDGTLLTATLTNKITKNTIPSDFFDNKSSIIDIYTNKEVLITNQSSYLSSVQK